MILQSRTLCEQVVDSLSPDQRQQILPGAGADADFAGALQDSLSVDPVRGSRLIEIHVDHSNPEVTALLANAVAHEFIKKHLEKRMSASTEAVRWLRQQAEGYQEQVKQTHLGSNIGPVHSRRSGTEGDINDLKAKLDSVTNPALIPAIANNPEVATLRQRLKEKQIQMAVLRERYKPNWMRPNRNSPSPATKAWKVSKPLSCWLRGWRAATSSWLTPCGRPENHTSRTKSAM
jgi:uncharacterized protein involved in exopolysaccharide biosynthesis